jgi:hypothetical protein
VEGIWPIKKEKEQRDVEASDELLKASTAAAFEMAW